MLTPEEQRRRAQANAAQAAAAQAQRDRQAAQARAREEQQTQARLAAIKTTPEYRQALAEAHRKAERRLSEVTGNEALIEVTGKEYGHEAEVTRAVVDELTKSYERQGYTTEVDTHSFQTGEHGRPGNSGSPDTREYWLKHNVWIRND